MCVLLYYAPLINSLCQQYNLAFNQLYVIYKDCLYYTHTAFVIPKLQHSKASRSSTYYKYTLYYIQLLCEISTNEEQIAQPGYVIFHQSDAQQAFSSNWSSQGVRCSIYFLPVTELSLKDFLEFLFFLFRDEEWTFLLNLANN